MHWGVRPETSRSIDLVGASLTEMVHFSGSNTPFIKAIMQHMTEGHNILLWLYMHRCTDPHTSYA